MSFWDLFKKKEKVDSNAGFIPTVPGSSSDASNTPAPAQSGTETGTATTTDSGASTFGGDAGGASGGDGGGI